LLHLLIAAAVRKTQNGQLSIEVFPVPFGVIFDSDHRWVLLSLLMPRVNLD
jgi:hypothetical protein